MIHDKKMPEGWHTIKSVLLTEICTAANFHLCNRAADALFHARLIGEGIAREMHGLDSDGCCAVEACDPQNEDPDT